jgi:two-component system, chemotaxis family, CheB/CheR fusion protein
MPVVEATDGMRLAPNHVYLSTPGRTLAMLQGVLHVMDHESDGRVALPIDYFFRSLAEDQGARAIGVILSGTGTDGTLGLKAIKAHAGMTMAQEAQSAKYAGMPESAIRSGAVDYVRPAGSMVEQICSTARTRPRSSWMPI